MFCHDNGVYCCPINSKREKDWKSKQEEKIFGTVQVLGEDKARWVPSSCDLIIGFTVSPHWCVTVEPPAGAQTNAFTPTCSGCFQVSAVLPSRALPTSEVFSRLKKCLNSLCFPESVDNCPSNCYGNGDCVSGTCHCFLGFLGPDCGRGRNLYLIKSSPLPFNLTFFLWKLYSCLYLLYTSPSLGVLK